VSERRLAAATLSGRGALTSVGDGDGDECRWRVADARKADLNSKL